MQSRMSIAICVFLILAAPAAARHVTVAEPRQYPVSKVITLLKDMQQQLEKEAEEDEEVYDKMMCWCKTNDKEKSEAIKEMEAKIEELTTLIETSAAASSRLKQEIENHEADLAKSQESLDTATSIREKQSEEFTGEEKDMIQSIKALEAAIIVLSRHHPEGTALVDSTTLEKMADLARMQMQRHKQLLRGAITPRQRRVILAFPQEAKSLRHGFTPQSGEIFGILKQMKETFESNLNEAQKEELASSRAYDDLKAAKMEEITATQQALNQKKRQLAEADETNAQSKEDIEETRNSLSADDDFLLNVKLKCQETQTEWESRSKLRADEISAVAQAISILSTDEAHDMFSRTFNPAFFVQIKSANRGDSNKEDARKAASVILSVAARSAKSPEMAALATSVQIDAFTKVKEAIDRMVAELVKEAADEVKHKDYCNNELHENQLSRESGERTQSDMNTKADGLKATISEIKKSLEGLQSEIEELRLQLKRTGEDRQRAKAEFQNILADQQETQKLLGKAISVLTVVYSKQALPPALMQHVSGRKQEPGAIPEGFANKEYKQSDAQGGVIALLRKILGDAKAMEQELVRDEQEAQQEYAEFEKDTTASIAAKQQEIITQNSEKAKAEGELTVTNQELRDTAAELETLMNTATALHLECDFILRNFDVRQEARDQEIEALRQAKAILSGMTLE